MRTRSGGGVKRTRGGVGEGGEGRGGRGGGSCDDGDVGVDQDGRGGVGLCGVAVPVSASPPPLPMELWVRISSFLMATVPVPTRDVECVEEGWKATMKALRVWSGAPCEEEPAATSSNALSSSFEPGTGHVLSMPVGQTQMMFVMGQICGASREAMRGVEGLPAVRMDGMREDLLEHMRVKWPVLRVAIEMTREECREAAQFWEGMGRHLKVVVEVSGYARLKTLTFNQPCCGSGTMGVGKMRQ